MTVPVRRWLPIVATAALAFLGGVAVGGRQGSAPTTSPGADPSEVADADQPGEVATPNTRPTTPNGSGAARAVRAAVLIATAFDGVGLLDDGHRRELLDTHAATAHREELDRTLGDVARLVRDRFDVDGDDIEGPESVWRSIPAGARVESLTADRAVVSVWGTGVVVVRGLAIVQPGWRTTYVEMVWERDAWRLVRFRSEAGPEPPVVGGTPDAAMRARLINDFVPLPVAVDLMEDLE